MDKIIELLEKKRELGAAKRALDWEYRTRLDNINKEFLDITSEIGLLKRGLDPEKVKIGMEVFKNYTRESNIDTNFSLDELLAFKYTLENLATLVEILDVMLSYRAILK